MHLAGQVSPENALSGLEHTSHQVAQRIGQALLQLGLDAYDQQQPEPKRFECECGGPATHKATRTGKVSSVLGTVEVNARTYQCRACGRSVSPRREQMGLNGRSFTPRLQEAMALVHQGLPERKGAELIRRLLGLRMSARTVAHVAVAWGQAMARQRLSGRLPPQPRFAHKSVYVGVDGTQVRTRKYGWREFKVGAIYDHHKHDQGYYGSFSPSEAFGREFWVYAEWAGATEASEVRRTGDGAHWVWDVHDTNFPDWTVSFVDFYHVSQRLWDYAKVRYGEGTSQCNRWAHAQCHTLKHQGPGPVLAALARHRPRQAKSREELRLLRGYLKGNLERMDYPGLRAAGIDIGDGPVETACKLLGARLKGADKRWLLDRAEAVAFLRCVYLSGEWDLIPRPRHAHRTPEQMAYIQPMITRYNQALSMN
jgi:hypothetical protein